MKKVLIAVLSISILASSGVKGGWFDWFRDWLEGDEIIKELREQEAEEISRYKKKKEEKVEKYREYQEWAYEKAGKAVGWLKKKRTGEELSWAEWLYARIDTEKRIDKYKENQQEVLNKKLAQINEKYDKKIAKRREEIKVEKAEQERVAEEERKRQEEERNRLEEEERELLEDAEDEWGEWPKDDRVREFTFEEEVPEEESSEKSSWY